MELRSSCLTVSTSGGVPGGTHEKILWCHSSGIDRTVHSQSTESYAARTAYLYGPLLEGM